MAWNDGGGHYQPPQQQFGTPQPPYTPPPPAPRLRKTPVLLSGVISTIAVIGVAVTAYVGLDRDDEPTAAPPAAPVPKATTSPATDPDGVVKPTTPLSSTVPGWKPVDAYRHGLAYDVPAAFQVKLPDTFVGFGDDQGKPLVIMTGVAGLEFNRCGVIRTGTFGGPKPDPNKPPMPADKAKNPIPKWANEIYPSATKQKPRVTFTKTGVLDVDGIQATHIQAKVTSVGKLRRCQSRHGVIDIVAFPSTNEHPIAFIMYADTSLPGEVPAPDREKILTSLRLR